MKVMTLRELINRLEELSRNGRNDNMPVFGYAEDGMIDMDVVGAWIDRFVSSNEEYEYVKLDLR